MSKSKIACTGSFTISKTVPGFTMFTGTVTSKKRQAGPPEARLYVCQLPQGGSHLVPSERHPQADPDWTETVEALRLLPFPRGGGESILYTW